MMRPFIEFDSKLVGRSTVSDIAVRLVAEPGGRQTAVCGQPERRSATIRPPTPPVTEKATEASQATARHTSRHVPPQVSIVSRMPACVQHIHILKRLVFSLA